MFLLPLSVFKLIELIKTAQLKNAVIVIKNTYNPHYNILFYPACQLKQEHERCGTATKPRVKQRFSVVKAVNPFFSANTGGFGDIGGFF